MIDRKVSNPSGYEMPRPTRFVILDDLSQGNKELHHYVEDLSSLIDSKSTVKVNKEDLIKRLRQKYISGNERGIYPEMDMLIGVGNTGVSIAQELDLGLPIIKVSPYRLNNNDGSSVISTRTGKTLIEEIRRDMHDSYSPSTIGIVDDTVFTGSTLYEVYSAAHECFKNTIITALTLTSVPEFLIEDIKANDMPLISALTIRTSMKNFNGLNSVDMKDFIDPNALPLSDGKTIPFMSEENWMRAWFGENYDDAMEVCRNIDVYIRDKRE